MEERTALLLGEEGMARLRAAHVILFGLGGVGGHAAEALARAGVGQLTLVDADTVAESNLNRQILALRSNLGQPKAQAAAARVRAINPDCRVQPVEMFYLPENADQVDLSQYDYVVDCIDTVAAKLGFSCLKRGITWWRRRFLRASSSPLLLSSRQERPFFCK